MDSIRFYKFDKNNKNQTHKPKFPKLNPPSLPLQTNKLNIKKTMKKDKLSNRILFLSPTVQAGW